MQENRLRPSRGRTHSCNPAHYGLCISLALLSEEIHNLSQKKLNDDDDDDDDGDKSNNMCKMKWIIENLGI